MSLSDDYKDIFAKYDLNGNGSIDADELASVLKDLRFEVRQKSTVRCFVDDSVGSARGNDSLFLLARIRP